jgi:hypothetical protein
MSVIATTVKHMLAAGAPHGAVVDAVTEIEVAMQFAQDARAGSQPWSGVREHEGIYGRGEGFVYFAAVGDPIPTHVKIGFSKGDPRLRVKSLQTGCPLPIRLLGFVIGTLSQEAELHDVLKDHRVQGEWFEYVGYVERVICNVMGCEAP